MPRPDSEAAGGLRLEGIIKRFGAVRALDGATLHAGPGTIHALLGENGAGKTTLVRVAFGLVHADAGTVMLDGRPIAPRSPAEALAAGVGMVHQHHALVPAMTVAENVVLGMRGRYDPRAARARVRELGERTGLAVDPDARVETLSVAARQRVEILKAVARDARVLILDEPTAVLAPAEARSLLEWVGGFARSGGTVILITHRLREALEAADRITVLRRGRTVLEAPAAGTSVESVAAAMLGEPPRDAEERGVLLEERPEPAAAAAGQPVASLAAAGTTHEPGSTPIEGVSLEIRAGEIVGVAAVDGSGERDLLRVLAGRIRPASGAVSLPDRIGLVPGDRHREALLLDAPLADNVALTGAARRRGWLDWRAIVERTRDILRRHDVRAAGPFAAARELSGGNQQKLVLGRELSAEPLLLVAENPTRGLDIRAAAAVRRALRDAARRGAAVVVHSSDLDELLEIADRLLVVHAGRVRAVPRDRELAGRAMLGVA